MTSLPSAPFRRPNPRSIRHASVSVAGGTLPEQQTHQQSEDDPVAGAAHPAIDHLSHDHAPSGAELPAVTAG